MYFAIPCFLGITIIAMVGIGAQVALKYCKWNTRCALIIKKIHRTLAYLLILIGFCGMFSGIYLYRSNHGMLFPLEWVNLVFTLLLFGGLEFFYQKY